MIVLIKLLNLKTMDYNLEQYILKYENADYLHLLEQTTKEVEHLDKIYLNIKKNHDDDGLIYYRKHVGDFLFYLNCGVVPADIGLNGLKKFLPLITNLVKKGQLKKEALEIFK